MPDNEKKQSLSFKQKYDAYLERQPQVSELLRKLTDFWHKNGLRIKVGVGILGILIVVFGAISIGRNLAALNRPGESLPAAIPTVEPSGTTQTKSVFNDLRNEVISFSALLPDPAPPAVDSNITLLAPER